MKTGLFAVLFVVLLAGALAVSYWKYSQSSGRQVAVAEQPPPARVPVPPIRNPLDLATAAEGEEPLPRLQESDGTVWRVLADLFGAMDLERILVSDRFIERFVLLVDNLPRRELPADRSPARPVPGTFLVEGEEGSESIGSANSRRYERHVRLASAVDSQRLVAAYVRHYPLFQEAYEEMGYPDGYFNDRLLEVIDHLLAAPEVSSPVRLVRPKVRYLYADSELEGLSAGHKIMVRIGKENSGKVKAKLREIRHHLAAGSAPAGAGTTGPR